MYKILGVTLYGAIFLGMFVGLSCVSDFKAASLIFVGSICLALLMALAEHLMRK